jgi:hypothetical protein
MEDQKSQEELTRRENVVKEPITKQPTQNPGRDIVRPNEIQTICFYTLYFRNAFNLGGR